MTNAELKKCLDNEGACLDALHWIGKRNAARAWRECPRGDWLLWIAARVGVDRKKLVLAACACARLALKYVPRGDKRPRTAIETAEKWVRGKATIDQVELVAAAIYNGYSYNSASASAGFAASSAFKAEKFDASYECCAAFYAVAACEGDVHAMRRKTANAVRKHISLRDVLAAIQKGRA